MTEIHIERRPPVWPWIAGVLALAALAWVLIGAMGDVEREPVGDPALVQRPVEGPRDHPIGTTGGVPAAIQDYAAFAGEADGVAPGVEHEHTAEGIRRLTAALAAYVEQQADDADLRNRFDRFRQAADRLQQDPQSMEHAGMVRDVFLSAVEVFESGRIDAGDVGRLRETASSISADRPLLDQVDRVRQFFRQSADTLERAARRT